MQLSSQIHKYRKAAHLTQEQLAAELGVTPQSVSNWERGGAPDIAMLPVIANYFKISIDELMGNDSVNLRERKRAVYQEISGIKEPAERLERLLEEYRSDPHDCVLMHRIISTIYSMQPEEQKILAPFVEELCRKILAETPDPDLRESVLFTMCRLRPREERGKWIARLPRRSLLRQESVRAHCLILDGNLEQGILWHDLARVLHFSEYFQKRYPDQVGAQKKAEVQRQSLAILDALKVQGELPAAWIGLYSYETLVLAACLFGIGVEAEHEGWACFERALRMFDAWFRIPKDAVLPTGFGGIGLTKDHTFAVFPDGSREYIGYCTNAFAVIEPSYLLYILKNRKEWAWMNGIREDERFLFAVKWVEDLL